MKKLMKKSYRLHDKNDNRKEVFSSLPNNNNKNKNKLDPNPIK